MDKQQQIVYRNSYINSLNNTISSSKVVIKKILDVFGWTEQLTNTENDWARDMVSCSVDPTHIVLGKNLKQHEEMCRWQQQGYGKDCVPLPSESTTRSKGTVTLDKASQAQVILEAAVRDPTMKIAFEIFSAGCQVARSYGDFIVVDTLQSSDYLWRQEQSSMVLFLPNWHVIFIKKFKTCDGTDRDVPQTSDRLFSDLTTDERRALYDHVVGLTRDTIPQLKEFAMPAVEDARSLGPLTREQLMAKERDAKRRRVRHRTLKVHTRSKNYTQVVREVINNQMSAYEDWLKAYHGAEGGTNTGQSERVGTEKEEGKPGGEQEMIWVEWDHSCNPHLWWKKVLENEQKEKERRKKRERSGSDERERRREGWGRKENRDYRREGYERERDRYDGDRRYRRDRHSHKKDRYEEERYSRDREKRRRGRESKSSKRSREESEEEEPRHKRIARNERERKTDNVRKNDDRSNGGLSTVVKEGNANCAQKEKLVKEEDNLLKKIKMEKDDKRSKNKAGNELTSESNLSEGVEIKLEKSMERDENCVVPDQALLQDDSLQTVKIIRKEGEESDENIENKVQTLLDDNLLETVREKFDRGKSLDETETLLGDKEKLLQTVREKLDRGETLDESETLLGDKLLKTVREKLGRGEPLDESEVRLARRFLFERLEMISKELPSVSSSYEDSDNSSRPKKLKKKKQKKKKQKSKKKHKEKKREGRSYLSD